MPSESDPDTASAPQFRGYLRDPVLARVAVEVPDLADGCVVDLVKVEGAVCRIAAAHVNPALVELAREWTHRYPEIEDAPFGVPNVIRTGVPELYEEIPKQLEELRSGNAGACTSDEEADVLTPKP